MNTFILPLLMAAPQASGDPGAAPSLMTTFLPFVAIIVIVYFLMIRPQNKKRKETEKMLAAIKKGDKVVTIGGLHGTIQTVKESTVIIKVDDNVKLEFLRSAISNVVQPSKDKEIEEKTEGQTSENGE
jgi:preprotein translocase subunit YajC